MQRSLCIALVVAAALSLNACAGTTLRGGVLEPPRPAMPVELTNYAGQPFSLDNERGRVVLAFFGYTSCPDVCPTALAHMVQVKRQLGDAFQHVRVVFITVDPNRDTPSRLAQYVPAFDRSFIGLTGSPIEVRRVLTAYQVKAVRRESADASTYTIDHTAFTYVIDKQGQLRELLTFGTPVEDIVSDVRLLLSE